MNFERRASTCGSESPKTSACSSPLYPKALYGEIRRSLGTIFPELARQKECRIVEGHLLPDHVHRKWQWRLKGYLLLVLSLAFPAVAWSQGGNQLAPGVVVLATLQSDVYAWSPNGQRLAYAMDDGIWVIEAPNFNRPERLIRKGRGPAHPIGQILWPPDGQKLAFVSSRPGDDWMTVWLADADGLHIRDLLPPGSPFSYPGVRAVGIDTWLSNQEVTFTQHCGTGCLALNKINVENSTYWDFCSVVDGGYHWAPTKSRAIASTRSGGLGVVEGKSAKLVSDVSSSAAQDCRPILQGCTGERGEGEWYSFDDWSPDGKQVLYTSQACRDWLPTTESEANLYLWEVDSGRQEQLVANAGYAAWSPEGSKIAFLLWGEPHYDKSQRLIGTDFAADKPFRVYLGIMEVATRSMLTLVPLTSEPITPRNVAGWSESPRWSPDGKQVMFRNVQGDLFLIRADGKDLQPITQGIRMEASWSPDGKKLALWPIARRARELGESQRLERFLPPVGKEDATLSEAEIIERYFQKILALDPKTLDTYPSFLREYAQALEEMGKQEAAEEQYRKGLELLRSTEKWRGTGRETELENAYAAFLRRQKRQQEAAAIEADSASHRRREMILRNRSVGPQPWGSATEAPPHAGAPPVPPGQRAFYLDEKGQLHRTGPPPAKQQLPPLYIVEVQEEGNSAEADAR